MDPNTVITIRTYAKEMQAQFALMELESNGIEAAISADDCGGTRPELQVGSGVRLLVNASDRDKAQDVLRVYERKLDDEAHSTPHDASHAKTVPSRCLWCLIGVIIASLAWGYYVYGRNNRTGIFSYDLNNDGHWDSWWTYEKGFPVTNEEDRDFDGKPDLVYRYKDGSLAKMESDENFDGKADSWRFYTNDLTASVEEDANFDGRIDTHYAFQHGLICSSEHDTDFNGVFDSYATYQSGTVQSVVVRPNGSKIVARREQYEDGILRTEWIDTDRDGTFDLKRSYDPMGMVVDETNLVEKVQIKY